MALLQTSTLSNQDISSALLAATYTATVARHVTVRMTADQVAGDGVYNAYLTIQRAGAGSAYRIVPGYVGIAAAGDTAVGFLWQRIWLNATDVLTVYIQGLAGDTTTPDIIVDVSDGEAADVQSISGDSTAADNLEALLESVVASTADTGSTASIILSAGLTEATADHYNGLVLAFRSGALAGQASVISDYSWSVGMGFVTVNPAFTEAPANTDAFVILPIRMVPAALSTQAAADVNTQVDTALSDVNLDHFVGTAIGIPAVPAGTYLDQIMDNGTAAFDRTTDSLQAIRDYTGTGLTAIPWNTAWDAEVESEANDALVALKLDHLVAVADGDDPVNNSIIAKLASKSATADWSDYNNTTDSLEANRDNLGTTGAGLTTLPWNATWDVEVESECNDALVALSLDHLLTTATAAADMTTEVADNTILSRVLAAGDTSAFVPATHNLQTLAARFTGITSLAAWLRGLFRKSTMDSTAKSEVNDGGGTFNEATDSLEAQQEYAVASRVATNFSGAFTAAVLANAPTTTAVYTVTKTSVGTAPEVNITQYQYAAFASIGITCDAAQTGDSHAFLVFDASAPGTVLWSLTTAGGEISVGGDGDLTVTVVDTDAHTSTAGEYRYVLRNTTDDTVVCEGALTIEAMPNVPA